ncbi:MAG: hypothetical protein LBD94_02985, partial [Rickettsiales bacterium]|nr:hypothetical protein [Rickettsiales bacterium]
KSVQNLKDAIERAQKIELNRFLFSIGIPEVGETTAKLLARHFSKLDAILAAKSNELQKVDGIGGVMADAIEKFFADERNQKIIGRLLDRIEVRDSAIEIRNMDNPLKGKKVVITGTLSQSRDKIKDLLESMGARVQSGISAKTDILIAGQNAGSKLAEAQKLSVAIWTETDMIGKIKKNIPDFQE